MNPALLKALIISGGTIGLGVPSIYYGYPHIAKLIGPASDNTEGGEKTSIKLSETATETSWPGETRDGVGKENLPAQGGNSGTEINSQNPGQKSQNIAGTSGNEDTQSVTPGQGGKASSESTSQDGKNSGGKDNESQTLGGNNGESGTGNVSTKPGDENTGKADAGQGDVSNGAGGPGTLPSAGTPAKAASGQDSSSRGSGS